jgi:glycosyltransferase involved in cell wall biosynthesis
LIGDGPTRPATERLVAKLGIGDRVDFLGDRNDVEQLLSRSNIFVLASIVDSLPISILEAMRAGLPVIASDVGGISELVKHGETGLLVPPRCVGAMTRALSELLADKSLRVRLGTAGRTCYEERFSLRKMIGCTREAYAEVLGRTVMPGGIEPSDLILDIRLKNPLFRNAGTADSEKC